METSVIFNKPFKDLNPHEAFVCNLMEDYRHSCVSIDDYIKENHTLLDKGRYRNVVYVRMVFVYVMYNRGIGWTQLSRILKKNHATMINSYKATCNLKETKDMLFARVFEKYAPIFEVLNIDKYL